jgi:putative DNA primase/helicase
MMFTGITDYKTIAEKIEGLLGEAPVERVQREQSDAAKRAALNELWLASKPVRAGDPVDLWMRGRGIAITDYPVCLRTCMQARYSGPPVSVHPAMLAKVTDATGRPATIHRTFLTTNGAKAPVEKVRMFCAGKVPPGGAVRLGPPNPVMGVAEGIETALAAAKLFGMPTWAALSDSGVEKFESPAGTERLAIFGDNDKNGAGQRAAFALAARLAARMNIEVKIPEAPGADWNDVLQSATNGG